MMRRWKRRSPRKPPKGLVVHFRNHIQIDRPIEEVFGFVADFRNVPKWNDFVQTVKQETEGPVGLDTRYRQIRRHDEQCFKVTEFNPPRSVSIESTLDSEPTFMMRSRFLQLGHQRTLVSVAWEMDSVRDRLRARLFSRRMKQSAAENLYKLKDLLETGRTALGDGRSVIR